MPYVLYEKKGRIACITLNRQERFNALGMELREELQQAEAQFFQDDEAWVAVYTGAGDRAFCSGLDLKEAAEKASQGAAPIQWSKRPPAIEQRKPTICAVNGVAFGGGCEFALRCDVRICSENAVFALAEVKRGLCPPSGSFTLPRLIGLSNALWWLMSGEPIDAQEAHRLGIVTKVVPLAELMPTAMKMAETICSNGPLAVRAVKQLAKQGMEVPMEHGYRLSLGLIDSVWGSEDAREGAKAFAEKRKPEWKLK